jgi:hypothetical protein
VFFIVGAASTEKGWFRYHIHTLDIDIGTMTSVTLDDLSTAGTLELAATIIGAALSLMTLLLLAARHWMKSAWANYHNIPLFFST